MNSLLLIHALVEEPGQHGTRLRLEIHRVPHSWLLVATLSHEGERNRG